MGHIQTNYTMNEVIDFAHINLIEILKDKDKPILLNQLATELNDRLKHKFPLNKKSFTKYLKTTYGGILKFLDDHIIYGIIKNNTIYKVTLINNFSSYISNTSYLKSLKRITNDNEWIIV